jgi:hypothetical protein
MFDSKVWVYIAVGILTFVLVFSVSFYYVIGQPRIQITEGTALSIINGVATAALATVATINMLESKKVRGEMVRPHLSLEPSFFEYDKDGQIRGFNCLNLVNGGTVARDVEIDISFRNKSSLLYTSSIGTTERVQIWNGQPDELGGNIVVAIRYKNMFNKNLQEVLSINIDALNSAKRKFVPIHKA